MPRHVRKRYDRPNANTYAAAEVLRIVMDAWVLDDVPDHRLAVVCGRTEAAVRQLRQKVLSRYVEGGRRESPIARLADGASVSRLLYGREPSSKEAAKVRELSRVWHRSVVQIEVITRLAPDDILKAINGGREMNKTVHTEKAL